jgi:hypothetical protein
MLACHATLPSLSPPPTLSLPQQLTSTPQTHTPDPITTRIFSHHITSHHITHMTLILHTAPPPLLHTHFHNTPAPNTRTHMHHHLPCPQPISRTTASSGLAHDAVQRRSLHLPHYQGCSSPDCHANTHIRSHSQPSANTQPTHLKSHPRPAATLTSSPPLRTSHTARPHTYTHTKQVQRTHTIISTPHHAHPLTTPLPDQPPSLCWSATPLYYPSLSTLLSLSLSLSRNHSHQPHTTDPITTHIFSHHITSHHTHDSRTPHCPPPLQYSPTSTTHQPPLYAHTRTHICITSHALVPSHVLQRPQAWHMTQSSTDHCTTLTTKAVPHQTATQPHAYAATANHQHTHSLHISKVIRDQLQH